MELSFTQCENILKTLPVGYYLGHKCPVKLIQGNDTYCDLLTHEICIGFGNLQKLAENSKNIPTENDIRALLYHEVSHLALTSKSCRPKKQTEFEIFNIFEDERIETVLKNYYFGVNFKENIKRLCDYKAGEKMKSAKQAFFWCVRFHDGPKDLVKEAEEIVKRYSYLTAASPGFTAASPNFEFFNYITDVLNFYKKFVDRYKEEIAKSGAAYSSGEQSEKTDKQSEKTNEQSKEINEQSGEPNKQSEDLSSIKNEIRKSICEQFKRKSTNAFIEPLEKIINQVLNKNANRSKSSNSYTGRIDPRSCSRDDYKWFIHKNANGSASRYNKVKLNLFIDNSGSFKNNREIVNDMLHALAALEKTFSDFSFDLITMARYNTLCEKEKRYIDPFGTNCLDKTILPIWKKVQDPNANVYNIVLFDGRACLGLSYGPSTYDSSSEEYKNYLAESEEAMTGKWFSVFDHPNCLIISDPTNKEQIEGNTSKCKVIISTNYVAELKKNILNSLQRMMV